jgi:protein-S-isoprenylcysteine O-methyltransferase Ste14
MIQDNTETLATSITENAKAHLLETTRWTKFLAIIGFISIALMLFLFLFMLFFSSALAAMAPSITSLGFLGYTLFLVFLFVLYIYPTTMLYRFSISVKQALLQGNEQLLETGFRYQKNMFKFMGIIIIALLLLYVIAFVGILAFKN